MKQPIAALILLSGNKKSELEWNETKLNKSGIEMRDWFYLPNFWKRINELNRISESAESPIPDLNKRNMITR